MSEVVQLAAAGLPATRGIKVSQGFIDAAVKAAGLAGSIKVRPGFMDAAVKAAGMAGSVKMPPSYAVSAAKIAGQAGSIKVRPGFIDAAVKAAGLAGGTVHLAGAIWEASGYTGGVPDENAVGLSERLGNGTYENHLATSANLEVVAAFLSALTFLLLVGAWLDYANEVDLSLTWRSRFSLVDDAGMIVGLPIAVYFRSLLVMRLLLSRFSR